VRQHRGRHPQRVAPTGRIGSAVTARASNTEASTAFLDGRNTAAAIDRVPMSTSRIT
jgi:hypothetical protein